jgi:hypothetical protein
MTSGWATPISLASALVLVAVAVGCGEEELAASDTDTKDAGFWAEASNEEKNELVVFCRRKEERVNPKVQRVSTSDLREAIDAYYSARGNETDTCRKRAVRQLAIWYRAWPSTRAAKRSTHGAPSSPAPSKAPTT